MSLLILTITAASFAGPAAAQHAEGLAELSKANYLLGEAEPDKDKRVRYLDKSISASDAALESEPGNAHALYWRSMSYLLKAEVVGGYKALRLVKQALRDLDVVASKDPAYDSAGAYRSRGKVLIDAPAWAFIGDRKKGLLLLKQAREIAPACLINRLYLAEACIKNGRLGEARAELDYIQAAPVDTAIPNDYLKIKGDAKKLLTEIEKAEGR